MKIIVSHDVDHISVIEHYKDLIIPKLIIRSFLEMFKGRISFKELRVRIISLFTNKLHNIEEVISFDLDSSVPSTFFVGVENGLGLSYSLKNAQKWVNKIEESGLDTGIHGIHYNDLEKIEYEKKRFLSFTKNSDLGIRLHYLRMEKNTGELLAKAGYGFDTSDYRLKNPYMIDKMWEFPLHMMDTYLISPDGVQSGSLEEVKERTLKIYNKAMKLDLHYFTVLFHDVYYSKNYAIYKAWYEWFIQWLKSKNHEFISYSKAMEEISSIDH